MFATPGDWHPTLGEFKKALTRLKPGKALDLGGWSSEILQSAFKTPHLRDLGHKWLVQTAVSTTLHARRAEMLHATKLVALDKGGWQLRPICASTIWVKLLSYLLLLPQAREHLDPTSEVLNSGSALLKEPVPCSCTSKLTWPGSRNMWPSNWISRMLFAPSTVRRVWRWFLSLTCVV